MQTTIPNEKLIKFIKGLLTFPYPQVCRHLVACDLISILEDEGWKFPVEFVDAVVRANDEEALYYLENINMAK
jgi:hypothetical protein